MMKLSSNVIFRAIQRFSGHVHHQRNQYNYVPLLMSRSIGTPALAKYFANEPRRRGPYMVEDETPVDTSKYSDVLIQLNGYDAAILTSYYHFVDQAARNMNFKVSKKFNLKTEDVNVALANPPHFFRERNMRYRFKNHGRMIQVDSIPAEKADIFIQYIENNIPAGVTVSIELKKWEDFVSPPSERNKDVVG